MLLVGKIGGTSMLGFDLVVENIIKNPVNFIPSKKPLKNPYGRIFVVSAYAGVTNFLLEHKKNRKAGIYEKFVKNINLQNQMEKLILYFKTINQKWEGIGLDIKKANNFIIERIITMFSLLKDLGRVLSSGYVIQENIYLAAREILASIGEVHSAYNSKLIVEAQGFNSNFMDLSGFQDTNICTIDERIMRNLKKCNFENTITFVTGYVKGIEGIMRKYDRGYSDITFSKICVLLKKKLNKAIKEAVIYKEFHLSSADPKIVGKDQVVTVGHTNYDVADQLADVGMEAIHPNASKPLEEEGINLRVKNTFEPYHEGTLISKFYQGKRARVEIITGSKKVVLIEVHDPRMVGEIGFDRDLCQILVDHKISYVFKSCNANSISHVIWEDTYSHNLKRELNKKYDKVVVESVAIVCVIGSNIAISGVLAQAAQAFGEVKTNVKCIGQSLRQVNMQFIIDRKDYEKSIKSLNLKFF